MNVQAKLKSEMKSSSHELQSSLVVIQRMDNEPCKRRDESAWGKRKQYFEVFILPIRWTSYPN